MQQMNRREKLWIGIKAFFWVAGLLISGSDNDVMPWVNGIGLLLFAAASLLLARQTVQLTSKTRTGFCFNGKSGKKENYSPFVHPVRVL
ncbi:MAG: hypothetical protein NDI81_18570 [Desulfobacula sp.]|nr:hypothetical protein [Desulfobacula sp.]